MDSPLRPVLQNHQENELYNDKKFITVTVTNCFTETFRVLKSKEKTLLKIFTKLLGSYFPAEVSVILDSVTDQCLWLEVNYPEKVSLEKTTEDSRKLYRDVVEEVETNMEFLFVKEMYKYHSFLLTKENGDFKLVFPFLKINRFDYRRLLQRFGHVAKAEPDRICALHQCRPDRLEQLTFQKRNPDLFHVYGFFMKNESEMIPIDGSSTRIRYLIYDGIGKFLQLWESYPGLFFPCVTEMKSNKMSHIRYPLIVSPDADERLGELVFAYSGAADTTTQYVYSALKSKLTEEHQRWPHLLFDWAKANQDKYEFRQVCPPVRHYFERFHPAKLPPAVSRKTMKVLDLNCSLSLSDFLTVAKEIEGELNPELVVLSYEEKELVCIVDETGNSWFQTKDVTKILGYKNPTEAAIRSVVSTDMVNFEEFKEVTKELLPGYDGKTIFMNESGLLSLVSSSKMPKAEDFRTWVTSDILPSIRKYAEYKLRTESRKLTAELKKELGKLTDKMSGMKPNLVIKAKNDGDCEVFSLIEKNDGSNQKHVIRTKKRHYISSLKQQKKKYPKLEVIQKIEDNPNTMNLNDRIKDWGKHSGFIQYKRNELSTTLSTNELISKIQEIHDERLK